MSGATGDSRAARLGQHCLDIQARICLSPSLLLDGTCRLSRKGPPATQSGMCKFALCHCKQYGHN